MNAHVKPTKASAAAGTIAPVTVKPAEAHGARLERLAAEADGMTDGEDLAKLSRKDRRKSLFA